MLLILATAYHVMVRHICNTIAHTSIVHIEKAKPSQREAQNCEQVVRSLISVDLPS